MSELGEEIFKLRNTGLTFISISTKYGKLSRQWSQQQYKKYCKENNVIIIKKGTDKSYHCFNGIQLKCGCCFQGKRLEQVIGWGGSSNPIVLT